MNCPHKDTSEQFELAWCKDCGAIRYREADGWSLPRVATKAITIVVSLLACQHTRRERVDGGGQWCVDCGAYYPRRGPVHIRHTSTVMLSLLLDDRGDLTGGRETDAANDSGEENRPSNKNEHLAAPDSGGEYAKERIKSQNDRQS